MYATDCVTFLLKFGNREKDILTYFLPRGNINCLSVLSVWLMQVKLKEWSKWHEMVKWNRWIMYKTRYSATNVPSKFIRMCLPCFCNKSIYFNPLGLAQYVPDEGYCHYLTQVIKLTTTFFPLAVSSWPCFETIERVKIKQSNVNSDSTGLAIKNDFENWL